MLQSVLGTNGRQKDNKIQNHIYIKCVDGKSSVIDNLRAFDTQYLFGMLRETESPGIIEKITGKIINEPFHKVILFGS